MEQQPQQDAVLLAGTNGAHANSHENDTSTSHPTSANGSGEPDPTTSVFRLMDLPNELIDMIVDEVALDDAREQKQPLRTGYATERQIDSVSLARVNKHFKNITMARFFDQADFFAITDTTPPAHAWLFGIPPAGRNARTWRFHPRGQIVRLGPQQHIQHLELGGYVAGAIAHPFQAYGKRIDPLPALRTLVFRDLGSNTPGSENFPWIPLPFEMLHLLKQSVRMLEDFVLMAPRLETVRVERDLQPFIISKVQQFPGQRNVNFILRRLQTGVNLDTIMVCVAQDLIKHKHRLPLSDARIGSIALKVLDTI